MCTREARQTNVSQHPTKQHIASLITYKKLFELQMCNQIGLF